MSKGNKFFTSNNIYFLPKINRFTQNQNKSSKKIDHSPNSFKPIEQIVFDKTSIDKVPHDNSLLLDTHKKVKSTLNLYNKYELLPKIMSKKQRINRNHSKQIEQVDNPIKEINNQKAINPIKQTQEAKQNVMQFNILPYYQRYREELEKAVSNIPFQLQANQSMHTMIIPETTKNEAQVDPPKHKYIRLKTESDQPKSIVSDQVPDFLMKLLPSQKE